MTSPVTMPDGSSGWLVTGYAEVRAALADPRLSLDKRHSRGWSGFSLPPALDANLLNMDPPAHTRIRALVTRAFTGRRVARLRPAIEAHAAALLSAVPAGGPVDLVEAYAAPLPLAVLGDLLGVPGDDRREFRGWTLRMLAPTSPTDVADAIAELHAYLTGLVAARRAAPGSDLLSDLVRARDHADRLSEDELVSLAFLLLLAGFENSVNLIANALYLILTGPVPADRPALADVVEEALRLEPPAPVSIRRFATCPMTLGDATVEPGDVVLLSIAGAGRDPRRFDAPDEFRPGRPDQGHLAFGHGIHHCVGATLARVEAEVALAAFLDRWPRPRLAVPADQLRWRPSTRTRALVELPVHPA